MALLQAASHEPQVIPSPSPLITYPQGGRTDPPRGRDMTMHYKATSHMVVLPPPAGEVAAGRRGVVEQEVGSGMFEVGSGGIGNGA